MKPMTIEKAAEYIGVDQQTLRRWEADGKISPERTAGGHRRYTIEQLRSVKTSGSLAYTGHDIARRLRMAADRIDAKWPDYHFPTRVTAHVLSSLEIVCPT